MRVITCYLCLIFLGFTACKGRGAGGADVVARVNDEMITLPEFEKRMGDVTRRMPGQKFENATEKKDLLNEMINQELLFQAAMQDNVVKHSERLKRMIVMEYLQVALKKEQFEPKDEEIKAYFNEHRLELERIRASHILFKFDASKPETVKAAEKKARDVVARLKKGEDFAKLAQQLSEDPAAKFKSGDLGFFNRARMVPEFSDAAFALKSVGDVTEPVKTPFGFHVIKLTGDERTPEALKNTIRWRLLESKRKEAADKMIERLKKDASIKVTEDRIALAKPAAPEVPLGQGIGQPFPGHPMPGQGMPGQGMPGQGMPGQGMPGQPVPVHPVPGATP